VVNALGPPAGLPGSAQPDTGGSRRSQLPHESTFLTCGVTASEAPSDRPHPLWASEDAAAISWSGRYVTQYRDIPRPACPPLRCIRSVRGFALTLRRPDGGSPRDGETSLRRRGGRLGYTLRSDPRPRLSREALVESPATDGANQVGTNHLTTLEKRFYIDTNYHSWGSSGSVATTDHLSRCIVLVQYSTTLSTTAAEVRRSVHHTVVAASADLCRPAVSGTPHGAAQFTPDTPTRRSRVTRPWFDDGSSSTRHSGGWTSSDAET
jgi:hypothetical protein